MRNQVIALPRRLKLLVALALDAISIWVVYTFATYTQTNSLSLNLIFSADQWLSAVLPIASILAALCYFKLYKSIIRYSGAESVLYIVRGVSLGCALWLVCAFFLNTINSVSVNFAIIFWAGSITLLSSYRILGSSWLKGSSYQELFGSITGSPKRTTHKRTIAIYGAGSAGQQLASALKLSNTHHPVAFIDDDITLSGKIIFGLPIFHSSSLNMLVKQLNPQEISLAIPSTSRARRREILNKLESLDIHIGTMPGLDELASGTVKIEELRDVDVADILGREEIKPDQELMGRCITGKSVMVTGAGGSIGSELCRQIIQHDPNLLILFENSEYNLFNIHTELEGILQRTRSKVFLIPVLGSVTQPWRLLEIIRKFSVNTIYHAAAYKHVPMVEYNSHHGFRNNTLGTLYTAQAAILANVENFLLISTDKAVRPTNVMGATKRLAELTLQALDKATTIRLIDAEKFHISNDTNVEVKTRFSMVRFGNVLESSGSVIPVFREQIKKGGPVTVTHPDIVRFFMTIPEAAQLVIQAGSMGEGGDVFLLDMGSPVKISELARKMINLSGFQVQEEANQSGDIRILYTGLRPGEKLYEELLIEDDAQRTAHQKIFKSKEKFLEWPELVLSIKNLRVNFNSKNFDAIRSQLLIEEISYKPNDDISDWLYSAPNELTPLLNQA